MRDADFLKKTLMAAGGLIVTLCGVVIGIWSHSMERTLDEVREGQRAIWRTLSERSSLLGRTDQLEERTKDHEQRLREIEALNGRYRHN